MLMRTKQKRDLSGRHDLPDGPDKQKAKANNRSLLLINIIDITSPLSDVKFMLLTEVLPVV